MRIGDTTQKLKRATKEVIRGAANTPLLVLRWCRITYPKLALLVISIIVAYYLFTLPTIKTFFENLGTLGYVGIFFAGLFFSFGFTAPFAIGIFATLNPENIALAALIGGFGALLSDLLIFRFIRFSFIDEFTRLQKIRPFRILSTSIKNNMAEKVRLYLLYALAGFIIASPLPDEVGISMLAGLTTIQMRKLAFISFIGNTCGIFTILLLTH